MRQLRRCNEKRWRESGLEIHRQIYVNHRNAVSADIRQMKVNYYNNLLDGADQKSAFKAVDTLLSVKSVQLPDIAPNKELCSLFSEFFDSKITKLRRDIDALDVSSSSHTTPRGSDVETPLDCLGAASEDEVRKTIESCAPKSSYLDPLPTSLLKDSLPAHVPVITELVNQSFSTGVFPTELKRAVITPLLKKATLDKNVLQNYRPVSSLPFVAKVVEKIAAKRLTHHLDTNNLQEELQSAYTPCHSPETALLKVQHDIASSMDKSEAVIMVLLDMSAEFDTIDSGILLQTLNTRFGVSGTALKWFESYMTDRTHSVRLGSDTSDARPLRYGVPQGSVMGPLMFTMYSAPVDDILKLYPDVSYHKFADDLQLYISYRPNVPGDLDRARDRLSQCIRDIKDWMIRHKLKLNDSKTEFLALMSPHHLKKFGLPSHLTVGDAQIKPVHSVRNLGANFDTHLTMKSYVDAVCSKGNFHLRRIASIRPFVTKRVCHSLVISLVSSNLDYCNGLLMNLPGCQLSRLQRIQNSAARLVSRTPPHMHISSAREDLHWLPVAERIQYKVLLYVYKSLHGAAPAYLRDLLTHKTRDPRLRQVHRLQLTVPPATRVVGKHAFGNSAPALWNKLPLPLREAPSVASFKRQLKTHLFVLAYR